MRKTGFAAGLSALLAGGMIAFAGLAYAADDSDSGDSGGSGGSGDSGGTTSIDGNSGSSGTTESGGVGRYGAFDVTKGAGAQGHDGSASTQCKQQFKINMYAPMQCQPQAATAAGADKHKHGGHKKVDKDSQESTSTRGNVGNSGQSNQGQNGQIALPGLSR